jgi:hypothetical protein
MMAKGGSFEREVAKQLSLWWTGAKRDDVFYRSHSSGARFTQRRKAGKDTALQAGDLTCSDPIGEPLIRIWNIECKKGYGGKGKIRDTEGEVMKIPVKQNGKIIKYIDKTTTIRWDILDILDSHQKEPVIIKMWKQCLRDSTLSNRTPVLIFRRNARSSCIMIGELYFTKLQSWLGNYSGFSCGIRGIGRGIGIIMPTKTFLEWAINLPEIIKTTL